MKKEDAVKQMILSDCVDIMDMFYRCDDKTRPIFMLGCIGYYALIIDGAIKWCNKANITLKLKPDKLFEKLRAKVKLFSSDSSITFEEQMRLYEEIISIEKQYFIDLQAKSGIWCPKFLIPDMGKFIINGHCIENTIQLAYEFSPFNPQKGPIIIAMNRKVNNFPLHQYFSFLIGHNIREIIKALSGCSYKSKDNHIVLPYSTKDIRIDNHHGIKAKNRAVQVINLCCRLNYILELLIPLSNPKSLLVFRLAYITFYHMEKDIENLQLSNRIYYHMPYQDKYFRNAMAHYSLYGKLEDPDIRKDKIGYGLFEKMLSSTYEEVSESLFSEMKKTRDSLEEYIKL